MGQKLGNMIQQQDNLNRSKSNATLSQSFGHQHQPSSIVYTFSQQDNSVGKPSATLNQSIGHQNTNSFSHHQNSNIPISHNIGQHHNTNYIYNFKQTESVASGRNRGNGIIPKPQNIIRQPQQIQKDSHSVNKWDDPVDDDDDEDFADILG